LARILLAHLRRERVRAQRFEIAEDGEDGVLDLVADVADELVLDLLHPLQLVDVLAEARRHLVEAPREVLELARAGPDRDAPVVLALVDALRVARERLER